MTFETNFNNGLSICETAFNLVGYMPTNEIKTTATSLRESFGLTLTVGGLATAVASFAVAYFRQDYKEICQEIAPKALFYAAQGALNFIRAKIENENLGALTLAYDLYNQKLLPYTNISPQFDIQSRIFSWVKVQLDQLDIPSILPNLAKAIQKNWAQ